MNKKDKNNNSFIIRKMQTATGGPIYEEDWSDRWEPYAAKIGLAGDVVGLGTAATGVGIPVGTAIAGFANIPNLIIDGYQTARDTWRSFNDNGNSLGSAAWNGGELLLDAVGLKALQYINKAAKAGVASEKYLTSTEKALDSKPWKRVGTGHGRVRARQSADHKRKYNSGRNKALEESNIELAKRGVRPTQGLYYQQKLTDEMAKRGYGVAVNDAIKSANRTLRQNLGIINGVNGGTNIYHILQHKQGGEMMNIIDFLKKGSGIHIKEKNRGKFTKSAKEAGQTVQEHARSVLNNPNATPLQKKRANFARNAAKWHHKNGGNLIKAQKGSKLGQTIFNIGSSVLQTSAQNKKIDQQANIDKTNNKLNLEALIQQSIKQNQDNIRNQYLQWVQDYQSGKTLDQPSQIVSQHLGYRQLSQDLAENEQKLKNQNAYIDAQARLQKSENTGNLISGILEQGMGLVGNYYSKNKKQQQSTISNFWTNPSLSEGTNNNFSFNTPTLTPPKTNYSFLT